MKKLSFRTNLSLIKNAKKTREAAPTAWIAGQVFGEEYLAAYSEVVGAAAGGLVKVPSPPMPSAQELESARNEVNERLKKVGESLEWNEVERRAFEWGFMGVLIAANK